MTILAEKIRKARETSVEVAGFRFKVRRPTDVEMLNLRGDGSVARLFPFVLGWEGVREIDLIPGGDPVEVKFDAETFGEWVSDRPDILSALVDAILSEYRRHAEQIGEQQKN